MKVKEYIVHVAAGLQRMQRFKGKGEVSLLGTGRANAHKTQDYVRSGREIELVRLRIHVRMKTENGRGRGKSSWS